METPGILRRHPEVVWLTTVAAVVVVVVLVANFFTDAFRDETPLSATGPSQLVAEVRGRHVGGYTGKILAKVDLDLPTGLTLAFAREMPFGGALLDGAHSMQYWYGGKTRQRVAIVGQNAEQDMFRDGGRVVLWDTNSQTYARESVPAKATGLPVGVGPMVLTPPGLTDTILGINSADSITTLRSGDEVAGRPTYELIVQPTSDKSLIGSVHIQVDGRQAVPLGVQIYPRDDDRAAVDVTFTSIGYGAAEDRNFTFHPPGTAQAHVLSALDPARARTTGSGWLTVVTYDTDRAAAALVRRVFGARMHLVKGRWGRGRLYRSPMLSVLLTSKRQLLIGPVDPSVLYAAVSH